MLKTIKAARLSPGMILCDREGTHCGRVEQVTAGALGVTVHLHPYHPINPSRLTFKPADRVHVDGVETPLFPPLTLRQREGLFEDTSDADPGL